MSIRLVSSAISGVATACLSLPFDNVKTKVMKQKAGIIIIYIFRTRWQETIQWID